MKNIKAVIFDWAGTTVDYGSFAPVAVFLEIFNQRLFQSEESAEVWILSSYIFRYENFI